MVSVRLPTYAYLFSVRASVQYCRGRCNFDHYWFYGNKQSPREVDLFLGHRPTKGAPGLLGDKPTSHLKSEGEVFSSDIIPSLYKIGSIYAPSLISANEHYWTNAYDGSVPPTCKRVCQGSLITSNTSEDIKLHFRSEADYSLPKIDVTVTGTIRIKSGRDWYEGDINFSVYWNYMRPDSTYEQTLHSKDGKAYTCRIFLYMMRVYVPSSGRSLQLGSVNRILALSHMDLTIYEAFRAGGVNADLVVNAMKKCQELTINSLAYIHDACRLKEDTKAVLKALKGLKKPKNWANLWLSYRYGLRLFIHDTVDIVKTAKRLYTQDNSHAIKTVYSSANAESEGLIIADASIKEIGHIKLFLDNRPSAKASLVREIRRFDLAPSLENIWDFIPYSFVVDWVIPLGSLCQRLDAALTTTVFPIVGSLVSNKIIYSLDQLPPPLHGSMLLKQYDRNFVPVSQLAQYTKTLSGLTLGGGLCDIKHGIDTVCMAYQRKSR